MAEVIPSNASFDPVTINLLSDAFEQARSQGSNIRQSVGSTSLCQHGARSDGQTYLQFGRARRARREQTQQKRIPIFHRELQDLCRLSWRPHGPPGLSEDPRCARLRFGGVIAGGGVISALLVVQVCSGLFTALS
jgi:hypothetical protein